MENSPFSSDLDPSLPEDTARQEPTADAPATSSAEASVAEPLASRTDFTELTTRVGAIRRELAKIIVGQQDLAELLLTALLADGHVLLEGVPGVAKTLTAKLLSRTLDVPFSRLQFTPDLMPSDVLGTSVFRPQRGEFEFRPGPIFASVVLIDEINRAPAKTQSALFEVMEERHVTQDGTTYAMPEPFLVLATQNPIEQEGTYRLPEAQLDRFLFKLHVGYPTMEEEVRILLGHHSGFGGTTTDAVQPVLTAAQLAEMRQLVRRQHVEPKLLEYIARLVGQTRAHKGLYLGASPRASIALLNGAKALGALRGRDFVTPEDIQYLAPAVLRHRIQLTPEREMEGGTPDDIVKQIIQQLEVPR
ncbi:MoxR family ATPase [Hymenobacter taeanensis]|uniref:MoxR family ATPase n=1 Tax=Hymenobacter taeanensis TaxID=2735321 RepID=A0A6M6BCP8_9BACT|nr:MULTISPECIES: MoxR family ATPase [Hymenobacter]QJX45742.1 MoxR family ATPase [Hymenobacter taeanensis]UOQ79582.1 MoxR family ATPase [Hymenobacter sp. 5414T-23]